MLLLPDPSVYVVATDFPFLCISPDRHVGFRFGDLPLKGFISQFWAHYLTFCLHFGDGAACSNGWYRIGRFRRFMESS